MKILLAHNYYGGAAPSGENRVFDTERDMLRQAGHEVRDYVRYSDELRVKGIRGAMEGALVTPWNPWAVAGVRRMVDDFLPDIVHVHNTFPLISPAIFRAIGGRAARVLTLHNYRLFCPAATLMRGGEVCTDCLDRRSVLPAIRHGCYRRSRLATLPLALSVSLHRNIDTWTRYVDAFIALTDFQREVMAAAGLPSYRVYVKPNFYPGRPELVAWEQRENYVVYVGRLSSEKGIETLIRAWLLWGEQAPELRVLGEGPLRAVLQRLVADSPTARIRFMGQVSRQEAVTCIAGAKLMVIPSVCVEGFPIVIVEAFALGTPVGVSDVGPLPSIVQRGISGIAFAPADPQALVREVAAIWHSPDALKVLSAGARAAFDRVYTEQENYQTLMGIYANAMETKQRRPKH